MTFRTLSMMFSAYKYGHKDPRTIEEAERSGDAEGWAAAWEDELLAQMKNKTWNIVN